MKIKNVRKQEIVTKFYILFHFLLPELSVSSCFVPTLTTLFKKQVKLSVY